MPSREPAPERAYWRCRYRSRFGCNEGPVGAWYPQSSVQQTTLGRATIRPSPSMPCTLEPVLGEIQADRGNLHGDHFSHHGCQTAILGTSLPFLLFRRRGEAFDGKGRLSPVFKHIIRSGSLVRASYWKLDIWDGRCV